MKPGINRSVAIFLAATIVFSLAAAGCSSLPKQTTQVEAYPECYQPIQSLHDAESNLALATAGGAVGGALLGFTVAMLAKGDAGTVAAATVGGAAAGAALMYFVGKSSNDKRLADTMARHVSQVDEYTDKLDITLALARAADKCYTREFNQAVADYQAGRINKTQFSARYVEIRSGISEAGAILNASAAEGFKMQQEYETVLAQEAGSLGVSQQEVAAMKQASAGTAAAKQQAKQEALAQGKAPAKSTAKPKTSKKTTAAKQVPPEEYSKLQDMAERSESLDYTLESMQAEQELYNQRVAAMDKVHADIMI